MLTLLATELPKLTTPSAPRDRSSDASPSQHHPAKRRRTESSHEAGSLPRDSGDRPPLPSSEMIDNVVVTYFSHIQPWIPMLHSTIFPQKLKSPEGLRQMQVVVHAICLAVEVHLPPGDGSLASPIFDSQWPVDRVRRWVISNALDEVTLGGLQALIILSFTDVSCQRLFQYLKSEGNWRRIKRRTLTIPIQIGSGNASRAWSLIASISRTVEFAQLTMEHDGDQRQPVCRPFMFMEPARTWTEQEERRRVFWCVFLLDRFCSITMGWSPSLKSLDVHQRMPCDGSIWKREIAGLTLYLGVWDKSTGGMGNTSCRCHHAADPSASLGTEPWAPPGSAIPSASPSQSVDLSTADMSRVGAFAYCLEATESMSRVASYFLQQRVNMDNPAEVNAWLARFKELDLRLVQWKMFLPMKWKTNVPPSSQLYGRLRIDPNLALAHVTHNTSTILLHQVMAYPPANWSFRKKLPSAWSADTCCLAAAEIATITAKYLEVTPSALPVTSAFAFCVYIAARMMIVHWRYEEENKLMEEFWSLLESLDAMSRRWMGYSTAQVVGRVCISTKYANHLRYLYKTCSDDGDFRILATSYTCEIDHRQSQATPDYQFGSTTMAQGVVGPPDLSTQSQAQEQWTNGITDGVILPDMATSVFPSQQPQSSVSEDMASMIGHLNDAMDMDRVIAFTDGALFMSELENATW